MTEQPLEALPNPDSLLSPEKTKRGWGRITLPQMLAILGLVGLAWGGVACLGLAILSSLTVNEMPGMITGMMGQFLGETVDDYMIRMTYRDAEAAADLFWADWSVTVERLADELESNYDAYDGYLEIRIAEAEGLPDDWAEYSDNETSTMEGREVTLRGEIVYEDGSTRPFEAQLVNSEGFWYLIEIDIASGEGD